MSLGVKSFIVLAPPDFLGLGAYEIFINFYMCRNSQFSRPFSGSLWIVLLQPIKNVVGSIYTRVSNFEKNLSSKLTIRLIGCTIDLQQLGYQSW